MVFSSLPFILAFMPLFFATYYLVPFSWKNLILLLGSLIFYFIGTIQVPEHFILFTISIVLDFYIGRAMENRPKWKGYFLTLGIGFHLICLGTFKYANFVLGEIGNLFPSVQIDLTFILPIGISFYTFQGISYLIDVYRGETRAEKSLLHYAVYLSMFPQLIAGPIVTYEAVADDLYRRNISLKRVMRGLGIFVFGLGLKVLLANPLGKLWSQVLAIGFESISTPLAWMAVFAFSFQLYFDFFGYSLMAIGLGKMLGFRIPKNFDHPYTSLTMTEFWRRWHMTLGSWFREYIYIPLGGNRCGKLRTILHLFLVWILTGVWHGAGYNFLLWGFFLFVILLIEKMWIGRYLNQHPFLGHLYMILLIPLSWSIFAVNDLGEWKILLTRLFPFFGQGVWSMFRHDYWKYLCQYYPFFLVGILFSTKLPYCWLKKITKKGILFLLLTGIAVASLYCMYRGFDDPFLYFRF